jgi:tRNA 2-thiouridine synthesizing protein A
MVEASEKLDCLGLMCPAPIVKLSKKIKKMEPGQVLELLADDEGSLEDVPAWCRKTGNELLDTVDTNGSWKFYVKKA